MSSINLLNAQRVVTRRMYLRLLGGATLSAALLAACKPVTAPAQPQAESNAQAEVASGLQSVAVNGVELHYIEQGQGDPIVLVHGGLADYREWEAQMERFSRNHRVVAYSQRYYYPNQNLPIVDGYTTLVDAQDLAALIQALDLGPSHIVGYSSGAYMSLAMTLEHPELVRSLVLAEPPILHWAEDAPGGETVYSEFMSSFWEPVGDAFRAGDKELALRKSLTFFAGADILDELPPEVRQSLEENLGGWEAFTTSQDNFPMLDRQQVSELSMPILLLTAENTLPIHKIVNAELARLLPQAERVEIAGASHEMWAEQPDACGEAVIAFLNEVEG
jgi:pimeloyl-ACP methyl ester carboxylesterase